MTAGWLAAGRPAPAGMAKMIDAPMTEPRLFESRFNSRCRGCMGPITTGEKVWGIKTPAGKWIVWHDRPICISAIKIAGVVDKRAVTTIVTAKPPGMSARELELLKLFEDEPR